MKRSSKSAISIALGVLSAGVCTNIRSAAQSKPGSGPVTVAEEPSAYTLSNGIVTARIDLKSTRLNSSHRL